MVNLIALILLYIYKYTFQLEEIIKPVEISNEVELFKKRNFALHSKSGLWGIILLYVSVLILIGCIEFTYGHIYLNPGENLFLSIFSVAVINKFLLFIALSFALASAGVLFYSNKWLKENDKPDNEYSKFIERFSLTLGIISILTLPVFVLNQLLKKPQLSLSGTVFSISLVVILLLLLSAHYYYLMIKEKHKLYVNHVLYIITITSVLVVIQDVNGFKTSSQKQVVTLSSKFDKMLASIAEKSGNAPKIDGKEIYDGRCAACHRFDQKLVGPAYKDVLPKYENKKSELINFIANPVKINPLFPPMPNQGLNVKQAEAVAEYILKTYKEK
jgi:cytochrome c